jgi:hypothetical protein
LKRRDGMWDAMRRPGEEAEAMPAGRVDGGWSFACSGVLCLALQMSLSFVHQLPAGGAGLRIRGNMWILLVSSGIPPLGLGIIPHSKSPAVPHSFCRMRPANPRAPRRGDNAKNLLWTRVWAGNPQQELSETLHPGFGGNNGGCNGVIVLLVWRLFVHSGSARVLPFVLCKR